MKLCVKKSSKFKNPLSSCHLIHKQLSKSAKADKNINVPKILEQDQVLGACLDYLDGEISSENVLEQSKESMRKNFICDIDPIYLFGAPVNPHYTVDYKTTLGGGVIDFLFGINPTLLRRRDLIMQLSLALEDEELLFKVIRSSGEHVAIHRGVIPEDKPLIAIGRGGPLSHALWVKGFIFRIDFTEEWSRMLELRYENDDLPKLNWIKTNYTNVPYLKCQQLDTRLPEDYRQSLLSIVQDENQQSEIKHQSRDQQQSKYQQQSKDQYQSNDQQQSRDQQQRSQVSVVQNMYSTQTSQNMNINAKHIDIYQSATAQEQGFMVNGRLISYSDIQSTMNELSPQSVNILVTKALKFQSWTCDDCVRKFKMTTYYFGQLKYHLQQTRHASIIFDKYMQSRTL